MRISTYCMPVGNMVKVDRASDGDYRITIEDSTEDKFSSSNVATLFFSPDAWAALKSAIAEQDAKERSEP